MGKAQGLPERPGNADASSWKEAERHGHARYPKGSTASMLNRHGCSAMDHTIKVAQASAADLEAALPLVERFFLEEGFYAPPGQIPRQLRALLEDAESAVFLAWQQGRAVGVATVTTTEGIELGLSAELEDLYVLPEARGRGAGQALIEEVADWCRQQGCSLVSVFVTPEGQAAHDLIGYYRGRGFVETGRTVLFRHLGEADGSGAESGRA